MKFNSAVRLVIEISSPSPRRAWIEIQCHEPVEVVRQWSPSPRRAWIEIIVVPSGFEICLIVALPTEGVD